MITFFPSRKPRHRLAQQDLRLIYGNKRTQARRWTWLDEAEEAGIYRRHEADPHSVLRFPEKRDSGNKQGETL